MVVGVSAGEYHFPLVCWMMRQWTGEPFKEKELLSKASAISFSIGPGSLNALREEPVSETSLVVEPALLAQLNDLMRQGNGEATWLEKPKTIE